MTDTGYNELQLHGVNQSRDMLFDISKHRAFVLLFLGAVHNFRTALDTSKYSRLLGSSQIGALSRYSFIIEPFSKCSKFQKYLVYNGRHRGTQSSLSISSRFNSIQLHSIWVSYSHYTTLRYETTLQPLQEYIIYKCFPPPNSTTRCCSEKMKRSLLAQSLTMYLSPPFFPCC